MHICYISQEYPPETGWGGIASYTYEMAHGLARAGHRVTVISRALARESVVEEGNITVHRLLLPTARWNTIPGLWRLNRFSLAISWLSFAWKALGRLQSIRRRAPVDLVEAAEFGASSFFAHCLPGGPRVLVRLHTAFIFIDRTNGIAPDMNKRLLYRLEGRSILQADAVTSPSRAVLDLTATWLPRLGRRDVCVIPNPIDTETFRPPSQPAELEVLFVGRLEPLKGVFTLAQAIPEVLRRCPAASFRLLGADGKDPTGHPWSERVLAGVPVDARHRVSIEHVARAALPACYQRAGLCVFPSRWENLPYVALEAMASGVPVVATRTGGLPELVVDGETGLLVPPDDAQSLADAICALLRDPSERRRMGRAARQRAEERYSLQAVIPEMERVYREVLR